jgi:GntR family trehalose operon transcriptional repressor
MPTQKYQQIYADLKEKIIEGKYEEFIPSENSLTKEYNCSRNTIRRAILALSENGFVQSVHGKGVQVIYEGDQRKVGFELGGIESLKEAAQRNNLDFKTKVISFAELVVDKRLNERTSFPVGSEIYYIQRVRYIDNDAMIIDHNFLLKDIARGLTSEIAEKSMYDYLERELGENIVTTKRKMTVERNTQLDEKYFDLKGYNCVAVISSHTYNASGTMFEYTQSRHRADIFAFYDQAKRVDWQ